MKGHLGFDPATRDYGPASDGVRRILTEWADVDWFVPPGHGDASELAARLFDLHHTRARGHAPAKFAADLETAIVLGNWSEFMQLCARVRTQQGWDWKYSALKPLSCAHSKARGWSPRDHAELYQHRLDSVHPGDLFVRIGDGVIWTGLGPKVAVESALTGQVAELARWYLGYADMDVIECLEWQLAEANDDLAGNPFHPLLRCYAVGFYPFSLAFDRVVLFGFEA
jgi:hypothetical protein